MPFLPPWEPSTKPVVQAKAPVPRAARLGSSARRRGACRPSPPPKHSPKGLQARSSGLVSAFREGWTYPNAALKRGVIAA